jgi:hypothetical protein
MVRKPNSLDELNRIEAQYKKSANNDHNRKRESQTEMNAPARTLRSMTKEEPLQQLFSHVSTLFPPTTKKNATPHVG